MREVPDCLGRHHDYRHPRPDVFRLQGRDGKCIDDPGDLTEFTNGFVSHRYGSLLRRASGVPIDQKKVKIGCRQLLLLKDAALHAVCNALAGGAHSEVTVADLSLRRALPGNFLQDPGGRWTPVTPVTYFWR